MVKRNVDDIMESNVAIALNQIRQNLIFHMCDIEISEK